MCDPVTIGATTALLSIGSSVAGYQAQQQQADRQEQSYWTNYRNAMKSFEIDNAAITDRQIQEQNSAAQRKLMNQREYDAAKATATTAATESGVGGLSLDAIMNDLAGQQSMRQDAVNSNLGMTIGQLQSQREGTAVNTENRVNSVQRGTPPSPLGLALQIGGNVLGGFTTYNKMSASQTRANIGSGGFI